MAEGLQLVRSLSQAEQRRTTNTYSGEAFGRFWSTAERIDRLPLYLGCVQPQFKTGGVSLRRLVMLDVDRITIRQVWTSTAQFVC